jgi:hypothetical protein
MVLYKDVWRWVDVNEITDDSSICCLEQQECGEQARVDLLMQCSLIL